MTRVPDTSKRGRRYYAFHTYHTNIVQYRNHIAHIAAYCKNIDIGGKVGMELGEIGLSSVESGIEHVSVPCRLIVSHPPPTQPGQCDLASGVHRPRFAPTQIAVRPCEQVLDMVVG